MKKTLIALAAVAVAGAASAQVTLSGYAAFGVQAYDGNDASFGFVDNSLKVTASEDLGGGMKVTAATQFALGGTRGDAAGITKEDTSLSLSTGSGTLTLANTRTGNAAVSAMLISGASLKYDQWQTLSTRYGADVVAFTFPSFNGLTATVQYLQRASTTSSATVADNKTTVLDVKYNAGALVLGGTIKKNSGNSEAATNEVSASYDMGVAKVAYGYVKAEGADSLSGFGVSVPVGAMTLGVSYGKTGSVKYYDAAAVYNLSKTTNVNASFGRHNSDADTQYRVKLIKNF